METRTLILTVLAMTATAVAQGLGKNLPRWRNVNLAWRHAANAVLLLLVGVVDKVTHGGTWVEATQAAMVVSGGPCLVMIVEAVGGGDGTDGMGGAAKRFAGAMLMLLCFGATTSCGGPGAKDVTDFLDKVVVGVLSSSQFLDVAEQAANAFFLKYPAPDAQSEVAKLLAEAHSALDAALQADQGAREVTQGNLDAAKDKFLVAYAKIVKTLQDLGVVDKPGKIALVRGERVALPVPLWVRQ